jgi:hypothetical protein
MEILERTRDKGGVIVHTNLPIVVSFEDYHEIDAFADMLTVLTTNALLVKGEEIGFKDGRYIGIFYRYKKDSDYYALKKKWCNDEEVDRDEG